MDQTSLPWPEETLCSYLFGLRYELLSVRTVQYAKLLLADYFASAAAGLVVNKQNNAILMDVYSLCEPGEECCVVFSDRRFCAPVCASVNAFLAHGADIDDGHRIMGGHPGAPIISAMLAVMEQLAFQRKVSGEQFILAMVCGYEAMIRLGAAVQPDHVAKAFHSTCTVGGAGAAIACAKLMGLNAVQMRNALSLALVHASGLMTVTETAQSVKPLNAADGARTGYMCARLAQAGMVGPDNVLMSKKGFIHAFGGDFGRVSFVTNGLGGDMAINGCYIKMYPTCRATHAGAEAMIALREQIDSANDIEKIRLYIYPRAITIAGDERNRVPKNGENAKFSLAFAIAKTFLDGGIRIEDIARFDANNNKQTLDLCEKVEYISDPATEDVLHGRRGCRLEVILKSGKVLQKEIVIPVGDPEAPITWMDMQNKFSNCVNPILGEQKAAELFTALASVEKHSDLSFLSSLYSCTDQ